MYDISIYISTIILYFTWATAGLEGERDAVSGKIVGAGVRLGAAQCREMTDGIISDPSGTGTHDHNHRRGGRVANISAFFFKNAFTKDSLRHYLKQVGHKGLFVLVDFM